MERRRKNSYFYKLLFESVVGSNNNSHGAPDVWHTHALDCKTPNERTNPFLLFVSISFLFFSFFFLILLFQREKKRERRECRGRQVVMYSSVIPRSQPKRHNNNNLFSSSSSSFCVCVCVCQLHLPCNMTGFIWKFLISFLSLYFFEVG